MRRLLKLLLLVPLGWLLVAGTPSAGASYGGGSGGTSSNGIWALSWWRGNPDGAGPYTGSPAGGVDLCSWHDVGSTVSELGRALSEASLPESFWTVPRSGGHPGVWGVLQWATTRSAKSRGGDHFDLVACPSAGELPATGGEVEADFPRARPPGSPPVYLFAFFDTVADPPANALPPVVKRAFDETRLPPPRIYTSPDRIGAVKEATVVNLPTWLWIDPAIWHGYVARARAGAVVATVWAYPTGLTWLAAWDFTSPSSDPERGVSLGPERVDRACPGPGVAYSPGSAPGGTGVCAVTFSEPTFGTRRPLEAEVSWSVFWAVSDVAGVVGGEGRYKTVLTSSSDPLRVMQVESIITAG